MERVSVPMRRTYVRGLVSAVHPKWDQAKWDQAKWDQAKWDQAKWDPAKWDATCVPIRWTFGG